MTSIIIGAKNREQLADNLAATQLALSPEGVRALDAASALPPECPGRMAEFQNGDSRLLDPKRSRGAATGSALCQRRGYSCYVADGRDKIELVEEIDLTPEQRARITELHSRLGSLTPHELLGVAPGADRKALRAAYHRLLGEFHSDRFFRKRLGSYRAKMDTVMARVTAAYEDLHARTERSPEARAAATPAHGRKFGDERERAMGELKRRYEERLAEARRHAEAAERAKKQGDVVGALQAYRKAAALAPNDAPIQAGIKAAEAASSSKAVEAHAKQAEFEERYGHWEEAAASWKRVLEADPGNVRARDRAAAAHARARRGGGA